MTDIFISYKREDRSYARMIAEYLIARGYSVWWDIELLPGDKFADEINIVLKDSKLIIVLWTPESIRSNWVKSEATIGLKNNTLLPVYLRETEIPVPFNTLHSLDLKSWFLDQDKASLNTLADAVERKIGPSKKISERITKEELNDALDRPKHEVEFWMSISTSPKQTATEYQLYIDKYGENGSFSELAFSRIRAIQGDGAKGPGIKNSLTILSIVMGIAVGGFTIAQILGVFEKAPTKEVEPVPSVFDSGNQQDNSIPAVYEIPDKLITYGKPLLIKAKTIKSNNSVIRSYPVDSATPPSPNGAAGNNGSNGNNGSGGAGDHGTAGNNGADGNPGKGAGEIKVVADRLIGNLKIINIGIGGGAGGAGGDGGKGGNGGSGANGVSGVFDCRSGPGNGGSGGNGGNGGDGGHGGKGGNGGPVIITLGQVESGGGLDIKTEGGTGGNSGEAGKAGQGGPRGSAPGLCSAGGRGPGANGVLGQAGKSFEPGSSGSNGQIEVTVGGATMSATGSFSRIY